MKDYRIEDGITVLINQCTSCGLTPYQRKHSVLMLVAEEMTARGCTKLEAIEELNRKLPRISERSQIRALILSRYGG